MLRRLPEIGVDFIDTADSYGPNVSEDLIREALAPYPNIVVATKAGLTRTGPNQWVPLGRPGISDPAGACEPPPPRRRDHRPLAIAPHRRQRAARRAIRGDQVADRRQGDPPCRLERGLGRGDRGGAACVSGRHGAEQVQSRRPRQRVRARLLRAPTASASSPGIRWRRASCRSRAARSTASAQAHQGDAGPDRARLAVEAQPRHAADSRHLQVAHLEENAGGGGDRAERRPSSTR